MNKTIIALLLLLLLTGCAAKPGNPTSSTAHFDKAEVPSVSVAPTEDPEHALETASAGCVQVYAVPCEEVHEVSPLGSNLLLFSGNDRTTLTLLNSSMEVLAQIQASCSVSPQDPAVRISEKGVTYYDPGTNAVIFLGPDLAENERIALPEKNTGFPVVSADRKYIFYSTGIEIRVLDVQTGFDRLLRTIGNGSYRLVNLHADSSILECSVSDNDVATAFISTQTGETLENINTSVVLYTGSNSYFLIQYDGNYPEKLAGAFGAEPQLLAGDRDDVIPYPLPEQNAVIYRSVTAGCTVLDYYDLATGIRPYRLQIPEKYEIYSITAGTAGNDVWMLCTDSEAGENMLCYWDAAKNVTGESKSHFQSRSTPEKPDLAGIARCREKADALGAEFGVRILLWDDAVEFSPSSYTPVPEYQVPLIDLCLEQLREILPAFPASFYCVPSLSNSEEPLRICLVRSLAGNISQRALARVPGLFMWSDDGIGYLFLTAGDDLSQNFCHEMSHVIDTRVLSSCSAYDNWNSLNPTGFEYDNDYIANQYRAETYLATGIRRYFVDTYSMSFPTEDRARILEYAMQDDSTYFESPNMQKKLRQICLGIRQAYALNKEDLPLLWEQHLSSPIA